MNLVAHFIIFYVLLLTLNFHFQPYTLKFWSFASSKSDGPAGAGNLATGNCPVFQWTFFPAGRHASCFLDLQWRPLSSPPVTSSSSPADSKIRLSFNCRPAVPFRLIFPGKLPKEAAPLMNPGTPAERPGWSVKIPSPDKSGITPERGAGWSLLLRDALRRPGASG